MLLGLGEQSHPELVRELEEFLGEVLIDFREDAGGVLVLDQGDDGLFGGLLDEGVLVGAEGEEETEEMVEGGEVEGVGEALGLDDEEGLKRVYYFLNLFPLVGVILEVEEVSLDDLVDLLVLFDEDEE